jgi:tetratricopeptide (TPR) repeat protein
MARKFAPGSAPAMVGIALALQSLGGWTEALTLLREARSIDPRSASTTYRLARALAWTRQYDEAERMADTVKKLSTSNLSYYEAKAISYLGQGNVDQARGELREAMRLVDSNRAVAYFATYYDLYWLLDEPQRQIALRLTPAAYDDDRGAWGLVMTALYRASGDKAKSTAYADSARIALQAQVAASNDAQTHVLYGLALAYSGRSDEATREVERGLAVEGRDDSFNGSYFLHQLVRVHLLNGQQDKALDRIERLLQIPYFISPAWLRVDPTFAPLKGNPRFEKLAGGT